MKKRETMLAGVFRLASPYFRSEEKWSAWLLLGVIIAMQLFDVYLSVLFNAWNNTFYNALQEKDAGTAWSQIIYFSVLAAIFIVNSVAQLYMTQWLTIRWRRWMTARYLDGWLENGRHYRMRLKGDPADNPDQRISEDVVQFVALTLQLGIGLLGSVVTLASFVAILWGLSATAPIVIGGTNYDFPGYLVVAAVAYAVIGTVLTHLIGRPLINLNFHRQRYEADFRFALVRLRENAEEVALLRGEGAEKLNLSQRFGNVIRNWYAIMARRKWLTAFTSGYGQTAIIFPFIVGMPAYFAGGIQLGGLMQIASAFGSVQTALSFFVTAYATVAEWKSVVDRLTGFEAALESASVPPARTPTQVAAPAGTARLTVEALEVDLPDGRLVVEVPDLSLGRGETLLLTGPSGSGKTSLLRALGGVWPFGIGRIAVPAGERVMVLPQRAYLPLGSLRDALIYPGRAGDPGIASEEEMAQALETVGLGKLIDELHAEAAWASRLSGGEQQRLSVARALLARPDWLFLDEATSALDEPSEAALYRVLRERLPEAGILSIGHRSTLAAFHGRQVSLERSGGHFRLPRAA